MRHHFAVPLALAIVVAGCAAPQGAEPLDPSAVQGGQGQGGGNVTNAPPAWQAFTGSLSTADNSGSSIEVFTGRVLDPNGERDLVTLTIARSGVVSGNSSHTITPQEANIPGAEPAAFGADGFKVWTDQPNDGVLHVKYRYTFPLGTPPGTATFTPRVEDKAHPPVQGPSDSTTVTLFSLLTVAPDPVGPSGNAQPGAGWGQWSAAPGATNVEGTNFIKITNNGQVAGAQVVVDFTEAAFVGQADLNFTVPIASNVEFAWWEDKTPLVTAPNEGTFAWLPANSDGSVTVQFSGLGNIIYAKYRVKALPAVLDAQSYGASYTATEL
jgi:hypothetical protein